MGLNIATIVPAIEKAKNIATEQYVDTAVASVDVSSTVNSSILSNNNMFAQKLGYSNYASMVASASNGQTIVNGGYINTSLIQANAITANKINTAGLIAENINATDIIGKNITGGTIRGARIEGAVIMASYLDLNGQLQVLTNYIISVATRNSNPAYYADAVYMSGTNDYRIPTISSILEETRTQDISSSGSVFNSKIRSYNCANAGHNIKCVKYNPTINTQYRKLLSLGFTTADISFQLLAVGFGIIYDGERGNQFTIYIAGQHMGSYYLKKDVQLEVPGSADDGSTNLHGYDLYFNGARLRTQTTINNGLFYLTLVPIYYSLSGYNVVERWEIYLAQGSYTTSFTDNNVGIIRITNDGGRTIPTSRGGKTITENAIASISYDSVTVNNMN